MEYGHGREDDRSIHQDFVTYGGEHPHIGSPRDWFAGDKFVATDDSSDLMEEYPPAANENHYKPYPQNNYQQQQNFAQPQALGIDNGGQLCNIEREHMFDKVVTPSDVGKLNRLVIPKQHAEKYFPLDSSSNEKGLLLNFEDLTGKAWRFRYSYWNSSQSYVMTKGWSRFVKEKKLDAGDIVSFQRGVNEKHSLFIDWKRRPITQLPVGMSHYHNQFYRSNGGILPSWSPFLLRSPPNRVHPGINFQIQNPSTHYHSGYSNGNYAGQVVTNNASVVYLTTPERIGMVQGMGGGGTGERIPVVQGKRLGSGEAKRLRLFGVNMECPISSDTSTSDEFEMLSSSIPLNSQTAHHLNNQYPSFPALMLPSTPRMYNSAPMSNKGKKSMSLDLEI